MDFFSKRFEYPVCGMYTLGHFLFVLVIGTLVAFGLFLSRNITEKGLRKQTLVFMIVLWVLEISKIGYNHLLGYFGWDQWVPLAFCSLLLYSGWLALSKRPLLHKMGVSWMISGGIIGGLSFLIYPSTSLTEVQAFHFLAFHSMSYHGAMLYLGILYFIHGDVDASLKNFRYYALFLGIIFPIVIILDYSLNVNLMFFHDAYKLPGFAKAIANWNLPIYTLLVAAFYIFVPYFVILGIDKFGDLLHRKKEEAILKEGEANE